MGSSGLNWVTLGYNGLLMVGVVYLVLPGFFYVLYRSLPSFTGFRTYCTGVYLVLLGFKSTVPELT